MRTLPAIVSEPKADEIQAAPVSTCWHGAGARHGGTSAGIGALESGRRTRALRGDAGKQALPGPRADRLRRQHADVASRRHLRAQGPGVARLLRPPRPVHDAHRRSCRRGAAGGIRLRTRSVEGRFRDQCRGPVPCPVAARPSCRLPGRRGRMPASSSISPAASALGPSSGTATSTRPIASNWNPRALRWSSCAPIRKGCACR